jgi:hypothetical protein
MMLRRKVDMVDGRKILEAESAFILLRQHFRRFAKHVSKDDNNNIWKGDAWTRLAAQAAEPYNSFRPYIVHAVQLFQNTDEYWIGRPVRQSFTAICECQFQQRSLTLVSIRCGY